jgi:hypothetical protein
MLLSRIHTDLYAAHPGHSYLLTTYSNLLYLFRNHAHSSRSLTIIYIRTDIVSEGVTNSQKRFLAAKKQQGCSFLPFELHNIIYVLACMYSNVISCYVGTQTLFCEVCKLLKFQSRIYYSEIAATIQIRGIILPQEHQPPETRTLDSLTKKTTTQNNQRTTTASFSTYHTTNIPLNVSLHNEHAN